MSVQKLASVTDSLITTPPFQEPFTPTSDKEPASPDPWGRSTQLDGSDPSRLLLELDGDTVATASANKRPLLLLTRSMGVQTDPHLHSRSSLAPSPLPAFDKQLSVDGRSESSSVTDSVPSVLSSVMERASSLLHRLILSDALTLTSRLKRQHLAGDVSHLSRTTVSSIVSEATLLRSNFRSLLEDDKIVTACTRKDLRALFNFLKDSFNELGALRMTLNDILLDPSLAPKISEAVMNPSKGLAAKEAAGGAAGWIAPIVKLFQGGEEKPTLLSLNIPAHGLLRSDTRGRTLTTQKLTPRVVPKLSPALSASTTTVNVEFQSGSAGRAITSTHSAHPSSSDPANPETQQSEDEMRAKTSASVMGIFAGAPVPVSPLDPWIVIPKPSRKPPSPLSRLANQSFETGETRSGHRRTLTVGRNTLKVNAQLSRVVDAVVDVQSPTAAATPSDYQATLAHRGLRPRGISDSSIHTTFLNHAEDQPGPSVKRQPVGGERTDQEPAPLGIFGSFGKVLAFRSVSSSSGPLSRGATSTTPAPKVDGISSSRSGSDLVPGSATNTSAAPSRMRASPMSIAREESDDDDLGGPAISRGPFFPIAGARMNADVWPVNESYVGSIRQEWMTARERGPGGRDY